MKKSNHLKFHTRDSLYTGAKETLYKLHDMLNKINVLDKKQNLVESIKDILVEVETEVDHITWAEEILRENKLADEYGYTRVEPKCFLFYYDGHDEAKTPLSLRLYTASYRCRVYEVYPKTNNNNKKWVLEVDGEKVFSSNNLSNCFETHCKITKSITNPFTFSNGSYQRIDWDKVDKLQKKHGFFNDYIQ